MPPPPDLTANLVHDLIGSSQKRKKEKNKKKR